MVLEFKEFLKERGSFSLGRDNDKPRGSKYVIIADKDGVYSYSGDTHGLESHAIKHLIEFEKDSYKHRLHSIRKIIMSNVDSIYFKKFGDSKILRQGTDITVGDFSPEILANTLDYINDKHINNEKIVGWEQECLPYIKKIANKYKGLLDQLENRAFDLTNISEEEGRSVFSKHSAFIVECVPKKDKKGRRLKLIIDIKNQSFLIKTFKQINKTFYSFTSHVNLKEKLQNKFVKIIPEYFMDLVEL